MAARNRDSMRRMGLRFDRSLRSMPGIRVSLSTSRVSASIGRRGASITIGRRGTRAAVAIAGTGLSYTEQSPWSRPTPSAAHGAPGIEVTELPRVEIDVPPVAEPPQPRDDTAPDDDAAERDPLLLPLALLIVALIAAGAVIWAALV